MTKRSGPKQRYTVEDHQKVLDDVAALLERHPSWSIETALTELRITASRYQYARERVKLARAQGWRPSSDGAQEPPVVHSDAYQPTRCQECQTARARSMWTGRAVCSGCYDNLKADYQQRAELARDLEPDEQEQRFDDVPPPTEEPEMEAKASRPIPMLSKEPEDDEQEVEAEGDDEDGVLDGMEIEFEDGSDGEEATPGDGVGQELVRVFVIEGTVDAVAAILERRFG